MNHFSHQPIYCLSVVHYSLLSGCVFVAVSMMSKMENARSRIACIVWKQRRHLVPPTF